MATNDSDDDTFHLGTDLDDGVPVDLGAEHLTRGVHLVGPPNAGKTNLLTHLYAQAVHRRDAAIIVITTKGDLIPRCRDLAIGVGQASRLQIFDPGDLTIVSHFNPLRRNGLSVADHAKWFREGLRSGLGQASFDATQQLAR